MIFLLYFAKELVPIGVTFFNKVVDAINTILNMCNSDIIADISKTERCLIG